MAKIFDFFTKNETPIKVEDGCKVTLITPPNYLGMNNIGGKLYEVLKPSVDFEQWRFLSELFHVPITMIRVDGKDMQSDVQKPGMIATALVNVETNELRFFNVIGLLPDLFKKE